MFNLFKKKEEKKEPYIVTVEEWETIKQMDKYFYKIYTALMKKAFKKATKNKKVDVKLFENVIRNKSSSEEVKNGFMSYLFFETINKLDRLEDLIKSNNKSGKSNKKSNNRNKLVKKK